MHSPNCLNCGEPLSPAKKFCATCGQKAVIKRLALYEIGHDALHYFTHADNNIFYLLKQLAVAPGKVAREFVAGRRKKYFPPLNFFLIVAAVCLFMAGVVYNSQVASTAKRYRATSSRSTQPLQRTIDPGMQKRGAGVGKFFAKYSNLVAMCAVPLLSFLIWLFYIKGRYNYAEHLVANMYISGFTVLFYSLVIQPVKLLVNSNYLVYIYFLFELVYRIISYYYFINKKDKAALVKAILANVVIVGFWFVLTSTLIRLYVMHGF